MCWAQSSALGSCQPTALLVAAAARIVSSAAGWSIARHTAGQIRLQYICTSRTAALWPSRCFADFPLGGEFLGTQEIRRSVVVSPPLSVFLRQLRGRAQSPHCLARFTLGGIHGTRQTQTQISPLRHADEERKDTQPPLDGVLGRLRQAKQPLCNHNQRPIIRTQVSKKRNENPRTHACTQRILNVKGRASDTHTHTHTQCTMHMQKRCARVRHHTIILMHKPKVVCISPSSGVTNPQNTSGREIPAHVPSCKRVLTISQSRIPCGRSHP
jgi:hypothetical protein|mmetsp:Transcript_80057/g.134037  ORF Transcript_80057/g.134037 Transcript_80057/m.134037 type:complete len:270 (-) Transcript_80057:2475-3284(-)